MIKPELVLRNASEIGPSKWNYGDGKISANYKGFSFTIREYSHEPAPYTRETEFKLTVSEKDNELIEVDSLEHPRVAELYHEILKGKKDNETKRLSEARKRLENSLTSD